MTEQGDDIPTATQREALDAPQRKPWSAPILTVRSVDAVTQGTKASTRTDGVFLFS